MKVLIVWAHPEARSFNGELVAAAARALTAAGHEVRVSDLYRQGFDPVATGADFVRRADPERLVYDAEQDAASAGGGFATRIAEAHADLVWCDLLILQFPLWWFSVPAILKGWIDRVMAKGVAYGGGRWYDRGGFRGRRAVLSITTAAFEAMCAERGINGDMAAILWPLQQGVLRFTGFETLAPQVAWAAPYADAEGRAAQVEAWCARLAGIADEVAEPHHGREDFDRGWTLREGVEPLTFGHGRRRPD